MALLEGKILDHYELRRLVGKGGMANVYEALDLLNHQKVAVKVFKREDEEMLRRFIREARVMSSLRHEHLVTIIDSGQYQVYSDIRYYMVMPYFEGGTLRARIRRTSLSLQETSQNLRNIASALDYIHSQGVIHRDIKASNILLNAANEVFLTDFGIAKISTDTTQLTSTGDVLGTVDYVAPELFEEHHPADAGSDLYSLGVLLYEMVTGRLPFAAESQLVVVSMHMNMRPPSPCSIVPTVSSKIERVLYKALEKKPGQRYASATKLAEAFCYAAFSSKKTKTLDSIHQTKIVQHEDAPISKVRNEAIKPTAISIATIDALSSQLTIVNTGVGQQFKAPQTVFKIEAVQPELPFNPLTLSQEGVRPPKRNRWIAVLLAFLALTLLVTSVIAIVLVIPRTKNEQTILNTTTQISTRTSAAVRATISKATPNLTATAMAAQAATATARAQETATAIAGLTVTAEVRASATAGVILTASSGKPIYVDALNNANSANAVEANWDQNSKCVFGSDGYHLKEGTDWHGCKESSNTYQNMTVTVAMKILSGLSGGLFFRVSTDVFGEYSGYLFEISSTGKYRISLFSQHISATITPLKNWTSSLALRQGYAASNTMQVIAQGNNLSLYANGMFLVKLADATYTSGLIAFFATTDGIKQAEVVYGNLKIYPMS